jgi:hypothetical protein
MANRRRPKVHTKELSQPISITDEGLARRLDAKAELLMDHFSIRRSWPALRRWHALAMCLAVKHVPGFRIVPSPGRKVKWTGRLRAELRLAVEKLLLEAKLPAKTVVWASDLLAKGEPWKSMVKGASKPGEALRKQYTRANSESVAALRRRREREAELMAKVGLGT